MDHAMFRVSKQSTCRAVFTALLTITWWAFSSLVLAQTPQSAPATPSEPPKGELDLEYLDASFGFAVRPPKGAICKAEKKMLGPSNYELVRFDQPAHNWSLAIRLASDARPPEADILGEKLIENFTSSKQYSKVELLRKENIRVASRRAARFAASFLAQDVDTFVTGKPTEWFHQEVVIQTGPAECYALTFMTPLKDAAVAERTFDRILASFEIRRSENTEKNLEEALRHGEQLLTAFKDGSLDLDKIVIPENYLLIRRGGVDIGFVGTQEVSGQSGGRRGMEVRQWNWLFAPDGTLINNEYFMYMSRDLLQESWEYSSRNLTVPQASGKRQLLLDMENAFRRKDKLLISYLPDTKARKLEEKVIQVEASYAPAIWFSLLPRIVDLQKRELYAFSAYSSFRRGLILRTIRVEGPRTINFANQSVEAIKIEDSEGLMPPITEIYVDRAGRILQVVAGPVEMIATTRAQVEAKFDARLQEAQKLFAQFMKTDEGQNPATPPAGPTPQPTPRRAHPGLP